MSYKPEFEMRNFFDLKEDELIVLNPYDFKAALNRLENLTKEDVMDDLKHFQKKDFEFRNYEEENTYNIDNIKFVTSTKNENGENDFYLLNDLSEYLISDEENEYLKRSDDKKEILDKKAYLEIKSQEGGKKDIFVKFFVNPEKISKNIIKNFIDKSPFEKAKNVKKGFEKIVGEKNDDFKVTIKIEKNSINKIYYNKNKGEYFFDLQSPPLFRTNFIVNKEENEKDYYNNIKDENCLFPFRNFEDEISNLKYRHFILMIQKKISDSTPKDENDINFDTNDELNNSLENLFKNRNGEIDKNKYIPIDYMLRN